MPGASRDSACKCLLLCLPVASRAKTWLCWLRVRVSYVRCVPHRDPGSTAGLVSPAPRDVTGAETKTRNKSGRSGETGPEQGCKPASVPENHDR